MNTPDETEAGRKNLALWVTVIIEGLIVVAVGAYNIYEVRRSSELVQRKLESLSVYSARQGEKVDRMMTALEFYVGKKFSPDEQTTTTPAATDQKVEKAIDFLETWKKKGGKAQPIDSPDESQPTRKPF